MDNWFVSKNLNKYCQNALSWQRCNSKTSRDQFVKQNDVRWSELLRLSYFDPVRFITVNSMHCLFMGIAKWIVKRIWVDEGILTPTHLKEIQKK